jgi:alkanesulfonate monooxygenase SsuD/methylene tetrahydromethanopterin reductase-like flavin-dependent oxidoreductase (luciferase family)
MVAQAVAADELGYRAVGIPEHHLMNFLMCPAPLQLAVKIASCTKHLDIVTSVAVLPIHDMRVFAGEVSMANALCDGRLILGVGRGAFAYEMARLGTPLERTREKFAESFEVLQKLLSEEEVSWDGDYYKFENLTVMPRPDEPLRYMVAALASDSIYYCARKGLNVQTTPLEGSVTVLAEQLSSFEKGRTEAGVDNALFVQRVLYAARNEQDAVEKRAIAYEYFKRFDNVFTGPGRLKGGFVELLPRKQTPEELAKNLLISPVPELVDRLGEYADLGIEHVIIGGFGAAHEDTLEMMNRFSEEVMPHFPADTIRLRDQRGSNTMQMGVWGRSE